jgi:Crp-like helix-turn-helix domain
VEKSFPDHCERILVSAHSDRLDEPHAIRVGPLQELKICNQSRFYPNTLFHLCGGDGNALVSRKAETHSTRCSSSSYLARSITACMTSPSVSPRWLMMCHSRIQSDQIPITHEFLAMMLGTRRSSVTVAAGMLHKAGLIVYSRGQVTIQNRDRLRDAACECFRIVDEEYVRLGLL